jgi:2-polyprenyl-6-methoxyphenol hydroxylase-like FAD-dependent oxidoreductase
VTCFPNLKPERNAPAVSCLLPKEEQTGMSILIGQRAIVIGAGIGGLSAAGVLAPYFRQVLILERDVLTPTAQARLGVPQGRHPHGLLAGGLKAVNEIFPGFEDALIKAGGVPVNVARDIRFEHPEIGRLPQRELGQSLVCASRPLLELVLRQKAEAIPNLEIRPGCRVTEIVSALSSANVQGVRLINQSGVSSSIDADLVVDASGRGAPTAALFDTLKLEQPETSAIDINLYYTSAVVELPERATRNWKLVLTLNDPPRGIADRAVLVPMERNRWMVTICQRGRLERIDGWSKYVSAFRDLIAPTIYDALRQARPVEELRQFAFPTSSWRHFERSPRLPRGLLPIADAFCRFNPIHGQGMSSAALQARLLRDVLEDAVAESDPVVALQQGFMAEVASVLETPWAMATSRDLMFPDTRGPRPENFQASVEFESAMFRAAVTDPVVHKAAMDVNQLLEPRSLLRSPHIMERIEAANGERTGWSHPGVMTGSSTLHLRTTIPRG